MTLVAMVRLLLLKLLWIHRVILTLVKLLCRRLSVGLAILTLTIRLRLSVGLLLRVALVWHLTIGLLLRVALVRVALVRIAKIGLHIFSFKF